jgi:hypothetical protein
MANSIEDKLRYLGRPSFAKLRRTAPRHKVAQAGRERLRPNRGFPGHPSYNA